MCEVLQVSRSGFYEWRGRPRCQRDVDDETIATIMTAAWNASRCTYGLPRLLPDVHDQLAAAGLGVRLGTRRARRLMRHHGIVGQTRRRWRHGCTRRDPKARPAPDLCNRDFTAAGPNQKWVTDITQIDTLTGPCFAAVVTDVWSRRIVGWAIDDHHRAELVTAAVKMAIAARRPEPGLILHSDQGSEFTSWDVHRLCSEHKIRQSMGTVGDCYDNAMAESVFATIETELLWQHTFTDLADATSHFIDFVEGFYNTTRRHTSIGNISPLQFESIHTNDYATPKS
jgi:putative transposase